jgi:SAM-dependent methyltransferase
VFERLSEAYRARPGYPEALVGRLLALVPAGARVVDLGAGTGLLAEPLARAGARVVAVEPARAMLAVCAERVAGLSVELVCAPAEYTGLRDASADLVLLADAAQWVDPEAAGHEAVTVEPRPADTPFMQALEALLAEANPERRPQGPGRGRQWLALASGGARVHALELAHDVELDLEKLGQVLRSLSYLAPALGPRRMEALVEEAKALALRHGGARWDRVLRLSWAGKHPLRRRERR